MPLSQFDERVPAVQVATLGTGTGVTVQGTLTGGVYGSRVDQFILTWNGAAAKEIDVRVEDTSSDVGFLGTVTIPAAVGTALSSLDVIAALLPASQPFVLLGPGYHLEFVNKVAITGTDALTYYVAGGDF